jgi:hypothetical protein
MFMVYWTEVRINDDGMMPFKETEACSKHFESDKMSDAMVWMEGLRKRKYNNGEEILFICMSSENPNQVGKMGVEQVGTDYNWTKRRYNERTA